LSFWLAVIPVCLAIVIVYFSLFKILKFLYQKHFLWFAASVILLSPFGFVLSQAQNFLELMWMLVLTPFYGVFVLLITFPIWIVRFYCSAFVILMIAQFLLQMGKPVYEPKSRNNFEVFWAQHQIGHVHFAAREKKRVNRIVRKGLSFVRGLWKYWSFVLAFVFLAALAATFVSGTSLRKPTILEAQQFVASDKTDSHPYVKGSYTCANFAADFRSNAIRAGYECGCVFVYFPDNSSHELNCFNTADEGLVFVEPQLDKFVNVTVGKSYQIGDIRALAVDNDTVLRYYIDWQMSPVKP